MPKMPWTRGLFQENTELHVLTSSLPLNRYRDIPRFLRWSLKIRRQLRNDPGCAGFTLDARLASKTFWTLSAWKNRDAMMRFVRSGEHAAMLRDMAGRVAGSKFAESATASSELPLDRSAARQRLANQHYQPANLTS
jgi:quinol monooxygenase YgiN